MDKFFVKCIMFTAVTIMALSGCTSNESREERREERREARAAAREARQAEQGDVRRVKSDDGRIDGFIRGTPAPHSKFKHLRIGMTHSEIMSLIGEGSDRRAYITGKGYVPFYFGNDITRFEVLYRGSGTLVYSDRWGYAVLVGINHDASESGYNSGRR